MNSYPFAHPLAILELLHAMETSPERSSLLRFGSDLCREAARAGLTPESGFDELARRLGELRRDGLVTWRDHPTMVPNEWREPTGIELYNASDFRITGRGRDQVLWARIPQVDLATEPAPATDPAGPAPVRASLTSVPMVDGAPLGLAALDVYAERMHRCLADDPEGAIGAAKDLVEATAKHVLLAEGETIEPAADMPSVVRRALKRIPLDEALTDKADEAVRRLLGSLNGTATALAELRNAHGSGHGRAIPGLADTAYGQLAAGAALCLSRLMIAATRSHSRQTPVVDTAAASTR